MPTKLMWHTDNQCESMTEGNIRKRNLTNQNIASYQLPFCDDIKMYFQVLMMIYVSIFNHIYMFFTIDWAQRRCYWQCNIQTMQRTQAADLFPAIDKYWMTTIQYTTTIHFIQVNRWHTLICIFQMVLLVKKKIGCQWNKYNLTRSKNRLNTFDVQQVKIKHIQWHILFVVIDSRLPEKNILTNKQHPAMPHCILILTYFLINPIRSLVSQHGPTV